MHIKKAAFAIVLAGALALTPVWAFAQTSSTSSSGKSGSPVSGSPSSSPSQPQQPDAKQRFEEYRLVVEQQLRVRHPYHVRLCERLPAVADQLIGRIGQQRDR